MQLCSKLPQNPRSWKKRTNANCFGGNDIKCICDSVTKMPKPLDKSGQTQSRSAQYDGRLSDLP